MNPKHIILVFVFSAGFVLFNGRYGIVSSTVIYMALAIIATATITSRLKTLRNQKSDNEQTIGENIDPNNAKEITQRHLKNTTGKREVYIDEEQVEGESYHENVKMIHINGERHYFYGITGKPKHPNINEPQTGFVRQILDCTNGVWLSYDNELRGIPNEVKTKPLADIEDHIKIKGSIARDKEDEDQYPKEADTIVQVGDQTGQKNHIEQDDIENQEQKSLKDKYLG